MVLAYGIYRVFFVYAHINGFGNRTSLPALTQDAGFPADVVRLSGLLSWGISGAVFFLVFAGAAAVLSYIFLAAASQRPGRSKMGLLGSLIAILAGVVWTAVGSNPFAVDSLNSFILDSLELLNIDMGRELFNAFTPMMLGITVLMVFACMSVLLLDGGGNADPALLLRHQARRVNTILFSGAILLVVGIVHANAVHHLPDVFLRDDDLDTWKSLVTSLSASAGAVWTMILIGIYLPSIAVLRFRAHAAAKVAVTGNEAETVSGWFAEHGLSVGFPQQLAQLAALISPFIVGGPASPLLGLLGG